MPGHFDFRNLTLELRQCMLREIDQDIADDVLYYSKRFTDAGRTAYPPFLRNAASDYNEEWLAQRLVGSFIDQELAAGKWKPVPCNAHTLVAQCEFNRFYCRGLCVHVLDNPQHNLRIYRARQSSKPRPQSEAKIGSTVVAHVVLDDLRKRIGTDVEFGLPEINSGLSLELALDASV